MKTEHRAYFRRAAIWLLVICLVSFFAYRSLFAYWWLGRLSSWPAAYVLLLALVPVSAFFIAYSRARISIRAHVYYTLVATFPPSLVFLLYQERMYGAYGNVKDVGFLVEGFRFFGPIAILWLSLILLAIGAAWLGGFLRRKEWKKDMSDAVLVAVVGRYVANQHGWTWPKRTKRRLWVFLLLAIFTAATTVLGYRRFFYKEKVQYDEELFFSPTYTPLSGRMGFIKLPLGWSIVEHPGDCRTFGTITTSEGIRISFDLGGGDNCADSMEARIRKQFEFKNLVWTRWKTIDGLRQVAWFTDKGLFRCRYLDHYAASFSAWLDSEEQIEEILPVLDTFRFPFKRPR